MNTCSVVIHYILKLQFVFPSTWVGKNPESSFFLSKPRQFPLTSSAQPLVLVTYLVFALTAITYFQKAVDLFLPSLLLTYNLKFPFPSFLSDCKGPFRPGWQGGWLWKIDWSVSLPLGGPLQLFHPFFFFFPEGLKSAGLSWKRYQSSRFPDVTLRPWWGRGWTERGLVYLCGSECFQLCLLLAKPNLCLQTTLIVWALFLVLVFPFSVPSPSHLSNHTALLWLFCSDPWGMDSMNLIGCLVYGVYDLENFVSPGLGYTKILIKKKNLWQRGLNVFVSVIANSWFLALCIKETFLSSVVSKASG